MDWAALLEIYGSSPLAITVPSTPPHCSDNARFAYLTLDYQLVSLSATNTRNTRFGESMYRVIMSAASMALACSACAGSSTQEPSVALISSSPAASVAVVGVPERTNVLPASTLLTVAALTDISSKTTNVGDALAFSVVGDVVENGAVAIPRGTPVKAVMIWKTRRGIGGKSGKFEIEFKSISLNGREYALRGKHRQEGKGNTVGVLLGLILISGHSALMVSGQTVNVFTAEPIPYY